VLLTASAVMQVHPGCYEIQPIRQSSFGEDIILPGREDLRNVKKSDCDQMLGKIECAFSLYDKRR
jgi:hypothetical protein